MQLTQSALAASFRRSAVAHDKQAEKYFRPGTLSIFNFSWAAEVVVRYCCDSVCVCARARAHLLMGEIYCQYSEHVIYDAVNQMVRFLWLGSVSARNKPPFRYPFDLFANCSCMQPFFRTPQAVIVMDLCVRVCVCLSLFSLSLFTSLNLFQNVCSGLCAKKFLSHNERTRTHSNKTTNPIRYYFNLR